MSRTWFSDDLETVATYWRIVRRDGVTLGLTTHDADLWFDGLLHRASPGMVPAAIRKSSGLEADLAEVSGSLDHDAITAADLGSGRYDGAIIAIGLVDWETLEHHSLYRGAIGTVSEDAGVFSAQLESRKAELQRDAVPRTSPSCRAAFCGPGCNLNPAKFVTEVSLSAVDVERNAAAFTPPPDPALFVGGRLRWLEGLQCGTEMTVMASAGTAGLVLDVPLDAAIPAGTRALILQGCDHTLDSCAARFGNAVNFRGEPFLPGNDLMLRYPAPPE